MYSLKRGGVKINSDFHPNLRESENLLKINSLKRSGMKMNSDFHPNLRECENYVFSLQTA